MDLNLIKLCQHKINVCAGICVCRARCGQLFCRLIAVTAPLQDLLADSLMIYPERALLSGGIHGMGSCREDFLSEWTRRGLVYRGDITSSIKEDCYMCQLHYLRYNLLIFEVDPSRVVSTLCNSKSPLPCHHPCAPTHSDHAQASRDRRGYRPRKLA